MGGTARRLRSVYEGTNGIQATGLVRCKLGLDNGRAFARLIGDTRRDVRGEELIRLVDTCDDIGRRLAEPGHDRLAVSYAFLTMLSIAVCGRLLEKQARATDDDAFGHVRRTVARFYGEQITPEALGLAAAAITSAKTLYAIDPQALAA